MNMLKSVAAAVALASFGGTAVHAAVLVSDSFTYADGALAGQDPAVGGAWTVFSGVGGTAVSVVGGQVSLAQGAGSREDVNSAFEGGYALGAGATLYSAFDLSVADPSAAITSTYFAMSTETGSIFNGRVWVTAPTTGGYRLAVSGDSSIADADGEAFSGDLAFGETYRVVTAYSYDTGDTTLWVNPTSEASPSVTTTDGAFGDEVVAYGFRQAAGNTIQTIDNLTVATTFAEVVPEPTSLALVGLGALGMLRRRRGR